jgi:hypothetical protein
VTPDDSCFYREPDAVILTSRAKTERFIGRLPRHIAYPVILVVSVALWTPVGVAALRFAEVITAWLR